MKHVALAMRETAFILRRIEYWQNVQKREPNTYTDRWQTASDVLSTLFAEMDRRSKL